MISWGASDRDELKYQPFSKFSNLRKVERGVKLFLVYIWDRCKPYSMQILYPFLAHKFVSFCSIISKWKSMHDFCY